MKSPMLSAITLFLGLTLIRGQNAATAGLAGRYDCGFADYMWPSAPDDAPTATGRGTIEFEADASGKITSASMSERVADDTRTFGARVCTFQLQSGESRMMSSAAGISTFNWKLNPGGDNHCGAYLRNQPNLGFVESARDYKTFTTTSQFFLEPNGNSKWIGANATGISVGICKPKP
jgi:hypothetical protein